MCGRIVARYWCPPVGDIAIVTLEAGHTIPLQPTVVGELLAFGVLKVDDRYVELRVTAALIVNGLSSLQYRSGQWDRLGACDNACHAGQKERRESDKQLHDESVKKEVGVSFGYLMVVGE